MLKVGDKFPTQTLEGTMGGENKSYTLGGASGKTQVYVFFPFAFTPN